MIVGSYYVQAYCDGIEEGNERDQLRHSFPDQYDPAPGGARFGPHPVDAGGRNKTEAHKELREQGWHLTKDERAYCPGCIALGKHRGNVSPPVASK